MEIRDLAYCMLLKARKIDLLLKQRNKTTMAIMEDMARIMTTWDAAQKLSRESTKESKARHWTFRLIGDINVPDDWKVTVLAAIYDLTSYVESKLAEKSSSQIASSMLHILIPCKSWKGKKWKDHLHVPEVRPEMVSLLLSHGANPDLVFGNGPHVSTAWSNSNLWYKPDSPIYKLLQEARRKGETVDKSIPVIEGSGRRRKKRR
jgi:hypothetical protein